MRLRVEAVMLLKAAPHMVVLCLAVGGCTTSRTAAGGKPKPRGWRPPDVLQVGMSYEDAKELLARHGHQKKGLDTRSQVSHFNDLGDELAEFASLGRTDGVLASGFYLQNGMRLALYGEGLMVKGKGADIRLHHRLVGASVSSRAPQNEKLGCWYSFRSALLSDSRVVLAGLSAEDAGKSEHTPILIYKGMDRKRAENAVKEAGGRQADVTNRSTGSVSGRVQYEMPGIAYASTVDGRNLWTLHWRLDLDFSKGETGEWVALAVVRPADNVGCSALPGGLHADVLSKTKEWNVIDLRDPLSCPRLAVRAKTATPAR